MKTFHVHIKVKDLNESIGFYSALFNTAPVVVEEDYAKWLLNDPKVNFAISPGQDAHGIEHLGIQTDSFGELQEVYSHLKAAKAEILDEGHTVCCYARSKKSWVTDPQGISWETFYTYGNATVYGEGIHAKKNAVHTAESSVNQTSASGMAEPCSCNCEV